jgi:hypothetical protein
MKMFDGTPRWYRAVVWTALLFVIWQAANSKVVWAADAIALSEPWRFVDESKPGAPIATGMLATTLEDAPVKVAARFTLSSTMQALALQLYDAELSALPLAQVDELRYCTRLVDGLRPYAVTLQINIDTDVRDGNRNWQGRLVYTPSYNGAVIQGEWQCWNTLVGKWWATGGPIAEYANVESPQPLGTLLARFPNLGIHESYSAVVLKAGDGWNYFQGEASPVVIVVEGERIEVAFGAAPQDGSQDNQVLLPVVFNEPQVSPQNENSRNKDKEKSAKNGKEQGKKDDKKENGRWRAVEWDDLRWGDFDWSSIDWEKIDWAFLDWEAFGWPDAQADEIRAFVEDVKQCKNKGWQEMGFNRPGDCVAYYVQAHTPAGHEWENLNWDDLNWNNYEWGRVWNNRDDRKWYDRRED